jgi:uncharacterized membrane protein YhaH (DUF805 family)
MNNGAAMPDSRFQFSLRQLFWWVTAVSIVCGLALARIDYLRYVEARDGSIPPETIGPSLFLAFLVLTTLVGLIVGPALCFLLALCRPRVRDTTDKWPPL